MPAARRFRAFTLIELLVVIAIIALLVAILLPSLGKARTAARLAQSMANIRAIVVANDTYRTDHKSSLPYMSTAGKYGATWSFAGKECSPYWQTFLGGIYDFPARTRPLNAYLYPEIRMDSTTTAASRLAIEIPVVKSPGDRATFQRNFPSPDKTISAYDDVGCSYQYNGRWFNQVVRPTIAQWSPWSYKISAAFGRACDSGQMATAKFVLYHDQAADIVSNDPSGRNWITEFGDRNKSVMAFLDSHVTYVEVIPNADFGPGYDFRFPLIDRINAAIRP